MLGHSWYINMESSPTNGYLWLFAKNKVNKVRHWKWCRGGSNRRGENIFGQERQSFIIILTICFGSGAVCGDLRVCVQLFKNFNLFYAMDPKM